MSEINSYRDLRVWQLAMDIAVRGYELTKDFPRSETYGMTSQIFRAAASMPANIAEGYGRDSTGDFVMFLSNAVEGVGDPLVTLRPRGARQRCRLAPVLQQCDELGKMLRAYIRSIQRSAED